MEYYFLKKSVDFTLGLTGQFCPVTVATYGSVIHPIWSSGASQNAFSNAERTAIGTGKKLAPVRFQLKPRKVGLKFGMGCM
jgi:hypothetical protein